MEFKKYQHLERFGTTEVENIEIGELYIFPKLDGTNASVWLNQQGEIQAGSRRRHLTLENDNAGFYAWVVKQDNVLKYLQKNPTHRLYGEWLVPHSLKTYRKDSWRNFFVFDVAVDKDESKILHKGDDTMEYLHYNEYKPLLEENGLNFIPPICVLQNSNSEQLMNQLEKNNFLIEDGKGIGEGIVAKNYSFTNKYGRNTFAKIVASEFKEKHIKAMGPPTIKGKNIIEEIIAEEFVTQALVEKVYSKIKNESGFTSKSIPRLLNSVFYDVVKEDTWNFVKKHNNPTINFTTLKHFVFSKTKAKMPHLF